MQPGTVVAERFQIEHLAGTGGMGSVYRALDTVTGQRVALKVMVVRRARREDHFAREARVLAELRHPAIVSYVAHGRMPSGEPYLAMEWLDGEDLADRLAREGALTVAETVTMGTRAAQALAFAHGRGVVHRDVKPSNLFLPGRRLERVTVLDFGIARFADARDRVTVPGQMMGTPGYMAPEQARRGREIDARADVFSLGCVLFECLTGRPAFVGEDALALQAKILLDEPPRAGELQPEVPAALDDLVARMLAKHPDQRPESGEAVWAELVALGELADGESPPRPRAVSIGHGEQQLLSVVLIGTPETAVDDEGIEVAWRDDPTAPNEDARGALARIASLARPLGGKAERLGGGAIVVSLPGAGAATDQAARAARLALETRAILPEAPMALATGRGVLARRAPVGEVIERAARLLREGRRMHVTIEETGPLTGPATLAERVGPVRRPAAASGPRPIRIDELTAGLLQARFQVGGDEAGLQLLAERDTPEVARTLLGKPTACVGRDAELAALEALFAGCVAESSARAVVVTAPAGVGKSRLRHELLRRLAERGGREEILFGRGDPMSAGSPFGMISRAIRGAIGLREGDPIEVRRLRLRGRVSRHLHGADLVRVTEFLGELTGVPVSAEGDSVQLRAARQDPMLMGDQMRRAFEDWLAEESAAQPVVIVLEDLHWGDLPSVRFVDSALRHLRDRPLFVLALGRPDVRELFPDLWAERGAQEMRLAELPRRACERLARQVLGERGDEATVARVVDHSAGNAFYLEELLRAVAEGKGAELPATVLAMVQARLEGLPPEVRRALRAAAVFGEVFWPGGVARLYGEGAVDVGPWLAELGRAELAARRPETRFPGEEEHVFRHALVREAAYAMLTERDRAVGHRLAGEWLEAAGERDAVALAEHFERGGEHARAAARWERAATQALEGNDFAAALARVGRGVACGATGDLLGRLRLVAAEAHRWRGELSAAESAGDDAMRFLQRGTSTWLTAAGETALDACRVGHVDLMAEVALELCAIEPPAGALEAWLVAAARTAEQSLLSGRADLADRLHALIDARTADVALAHPLAAARAHASRAFRALFSGDPALCVGSFQRSADAYLAAGDLRGHCVQQGNAGYACLQIGAWAEAEAALREALAAAERMGLHNIVAAARQNLGLVLLHAGRVDEACLLEEEAARAFAAQGDHRMEGGSTNYLARALAARGELGRAEAAAHHAVDILGAVPGARASALATLGHVLLAVGRPREALEFTGEALALLERLGGIEEGEGMLRLTHAEALLAGGAEHEASAVLAIARDRILERAARIGDERYRRMFLEDVPENAQILALAPALHDPRA